MPEKPVFQPGERLFLWLLVALSAAVLVYAFTLPHANLSSPGTFPLLTGLLMITTAIKVLWSKRKSSQDRAWKEDLKEAGRLIFPKTVIIFILALVAYILLLGKLPFVVSSYLFMVGTFIFLKGTESWLKALVVAGGVLAGIYLVFQYIFKVVLW